MAYDAELVISVVSAEAYSTVHVRINAETEEETDVQCTEREARNLIRAVAAEISRWDEQRILDDLDEVPS